MSVMFCLFLYDVKNRTKVARIDLVDVFISLLLCTRFEKE